MYSDERKEVLLWFIAAIAALNLNRILLSVKSAALKRNAADIAGTIIDGAAIICAGTAAAPYPVAAGVLITFVPDIYDGVVKSPDNFEVVYHHYLNNDVYLTRDGRLVHSQAMGELQNISVAADTPRPV